MVALASNIYIFQKNWWSIKKNKGCSHIITSSHCVMLLLLYHSVWCFNNCASVQNRRGLSCWQAPSEHERYLRFAISRVTLFLMRALGMVWKYVCLNGKYNCSFHSRSTVVNSSVLFYIAVTSLRPVYFLHHHSFIHSTFSHLDSYHSQPLRHSHYYIAINPFSALFTLSMPRYSIRSSPILALPIIFFTCVIRC